MDEVVVKLTEWGFESYAEKFVSKYIRQIILIQSMHVVSVQQIYNLIII